MPLPVSAIVISTPLRPDGWPVNPEAVNTRMVPPGGVASSALMIMLISTPWIWLRSTISSGRFSPGLSLMATPFIRAWFSTSAIAEAARRLMSVGSGSSFVWREKSSRPLTILRTRSVASAMICRSVRTSSARSDRRSSMWV